MKAFQSVIFVAKENTVVEEMKITGDGAYSVSYVHDYKPDAQYLLFDAVGVVIYNGVLIKAERNIACFVPLENGDAIVLLAEDPETNIDVLILTWGKPDGPEIRRSHRRRVV